MIALLETFFGSKVGRYIAEIVLVLALVGTAVLHYEHKGAAEELGKLKSSSVALVAKAQKDITRETAAHAADVKANQEKTDAALTANIVLQSELTQRVRDFDAYRAKHPDLPRTASGSSPTGSGECGVAGCGDVAVQLAERGNDLADSLGQTVAALQSCQRDRDSLTGLPK